MNETDELYAAQLVTLTQLLNAETDPRAKQVVQDCIDRNNQAREIAAEWNRNNGDQA